MYSALVILFRVLKIVRIQDCLGENPDCKYLFAVAVIAAANTCDNNMQGKPLYINSI